KSIEDIKAFKVAFAKRFKMTDQGSIGQFLGMKIERSDDNQSFLISQTANIRSMLERFNMKDLTPIDSPLDPKQRLVPFEGEASGGEGRWFLHPNYRMDFLEAMKWQEDWKETAKDIFRSNYEAFYKVVPLESQDDQDTPDNGKEDAEEDPVIAAMMKRSIARRAEAKAVDPIEEWLADVTPRARHDYNILRLLRL
ncbi:unnamed protein product, partial [Tilletia laevis]